jgi:hypothetical protein
LRGSNWIIYLGAMMEADSVGRDTRATQASVIFNERKPDQKDKNTVCSEEWLQRRVVEDMK